MKMSFGDKKETKIFFQRLLFYDVLIEKLNLKIKKKIDLLHELQFYDKLNIYETLRSFGWYAGIYKVEINTQNRLKTFLAQERIENQALKICLKALYMKLKSLNIKQQ